MGQAEFGIHFGSDLGGQNRSQMSQNSSLNPGLLLMLRFIALEVSWVGLGDQFWGHVGVLLGIPVREAGFLKTSSNNLQKNPGFERFRGSNIMQKTGPETASGRSWAARASWEALPVHLGAIWGGHF